MVITRDGRLISRQDVSIFRASFVRCTNHLAQYSAARILQVVAAPPLYVVPSLCSIFWMSSDSH
jgi:hypothetical protein